MVARTKPCNDELIVDFTDSRGMIIHRERVGDGVQAAAVITAAIARRKELRAGDLIRVVVPCNCSRPVLAQGCRLARCSKTAAIWGTADIKSM
jgi:hypothetical protein